MQYIGGGADSDIILDICEKVAPHKVRYVWFDTGLEYTATKQHIKKLETEYGIIVEREKPIKTIPQTNREYGQPFISKYISQNIERLQKHNFDWKDEPLEKSIVKFPNCKSALRWFNNDYTKPEYTVSRFDINYKKYLREFLIAHPPWFRISDKCCQYAKKDVSKHYIKREKIDLMLIGVRKAESGVRAGAYKNCFSVSTHYGCSQYRPIFWFKDSDRREYEKLFNIKHSDCYSVYGLKRTGCALCGFARPQENEAEVCKLYEPKLYNAGIHIFADSMEYTKMYYDFRSRLDNKT